MNVIVDEYKNQAGVLADKLFVVLEQQATRITTLNEKNQRLKREVENQRLRCEVERLQSEVEGHKRETACLKSDVESHARKIDGLTSEFESRKRERDDPESDINRPNKMRRFGIIRSYFDRI